MRRVWAANQGFSGAHHFTRCVSVTKWRPNSLWISRNNPGGHLHSDPASARCGVLRKQQAHIAAQADILIRGFATVGIIALVDEVTGYQEIRDRAALHKILDQYLEKEHAKRSKRFPDEFYREIFRLRDWE